MVGTPNPYKIERYATLNRKKKKETRSKRKVVYVLEELQQTLDISVNQFNIVLG